MGIFKDCWQLLKRCWKTILLFEFVYKALCIMVFVPISLGLYNLALKCAGLNYLSGETISQLLSSPLSVVLLVVLLVIFAIIALFEMTALVYCFDMAHNGHQVTLTQMLVAGFKRAKDVIFPRNWLLIVYVLLILPLTGFAIASSFTPTIEIPEFIMDFITNRTPLFILFIAVMVFLVLMVVKWLFALHYFTLENCDFKEARRRSKRLIKGKYWRTLGQLVVWELIFAAAMVIIIVALSLLAILFGNLAPSGSSGYLTVFAFISIMIKVVALVFAFFIAPVAFTCVSGQYYRLKGQKGESYQAALEPMQPHKFWARSKRWIILVTVIALGLNTLYGVQTLRGEVDLKTDIINYPQVTAHRGDSVSAPENTIPAFEQAIKNQADWGELDVQETKDGVIVVSHDSSLKRTTGVDKEINDVTYAELKDLDAGSWFGSEWSWVRIARLDDLLKACKGQIKLNIELKPTGREQALQESVAQIVRDNGYVGHCVVASLKYDALVKMKKVAPEIDTCYLMTMADGDFASLPAADNFSIEASAIDQKVVDQVHAADKKLLAWTINTEEHLMEMTALGVDNLVTDNPVLARQVIYAKDLNHNITGLLHYLLK